jgi:hypothetical protein
MASERDIQDAERAKLEAIVAEHGNKREQFELLLSVVRRNGITLGQFEGTEPPVGYLPPEPEFLTRLGRRVERRAKLGLPPVQCAGDPPTRHGCNCLERALDEPGDGGKRAVLKLAAALHWSPPRRTEAVRPAEEPTPRPEAEQEPLAAPGPLPDPKPAEAAPPVRVVHRVRRWYDDSERPRFSDMKF